MLHDLCSRVVVIFYGSREVHGDVVGGEEGDF